MLVVSASEFLMSKEACYAKLDRSIQEAKEGKTYVKLPNESLSEFLRRTELMYRHACRRVRRR